MSSRSRIRPTAKKLWRVAIIRNKGQVLGHVEAASRAKAELAAIKAFGLDPARRKHLLVQEYA